MLKYGTTPIHLASYQGHIDTVCALIDMGSSPTIAAENKVAIITTEYWLPSAPCKTLQLDYQPIHFAASRGHVKLVNELIEKYGVDPETTDSVTYENCLLLTECTVITIGG